LITTAGQERETSEKRETGKNRPGFPPFFHISPFSLFAHVPTFSPALPSRYITKFISFFST
jgi:hypothetical protein